MNYTEFNGKKVRVILKDGDIFEGISEESPDEYNELVLGRLEPGIQICDYILFDSEIQSIQLLPPPENGCEATDQELLMKFALRHSFSEHLMRWEDNELPDKYDHNYFEYNGQPFPGELQQAIYYQQERKDTFLKLQGSEPLANDFGLSASVTLSMELQGDFRSWKTNPNLEFRKPELSDLEELELFHYGPVYGESFTERNLHRLFLELSYHGVYQDGEIVASCYTYTTPKYVCLDGLLVDLDHRRQSVATSLLAHIAEMAVGRTLYLHADEKDEPRKLYEKLGFRETSRTYEYLCTDLSRLQMQFE